MKYTLIFLLAILLLAYSSRSFAQGTVSMPPPIDWQIEYYDSVANQPIQSEYPNIPHILDSLYQRLDPSNIPSGRLLDRAVQYVHTERYNGVVTDSNDVAFGDVLLLHNTLQNANVDTAKLLPEPDSSLIRRYAENDTLPFVWVIASYETFKPYAADSGLIGFDTLTTQFIDLDSLLVDTLQLESPYETKWAFAVAPMLMETHQLNTVFSFPEGLMMSSFGTPDTAYVDFGVGEGEVVVTPGSAVAVNWPGDGEYTFRVRVPKPGGGDLESETVFKVGKTAQYGDWEEQDRIRVQRPLGSGNVEARWFVNLNPCHTEIVRPFIVVEGFEPQSLPEFSERNNRVSFFNKTVNVIVDENPLITLNQWLEREEYDLIYVEWDNGADHIRNNAAVIKEVIRQVNAMKSVEGNPNVVFGESMGGLVARVALREMEIDNEDHDTELYMSSDAPHQGANIPLGMQVFIDDMVDMTTKILDKTRVIDFAMSARRDDLIDARAQAVGARVALRTPAAREMLIYHFETYSYSPPGHMPERQNLMNYLEQIGMPQNCRSVCLSNGCETGVLQDFITESQNLVHLYQDFASGYFPLTYRYPGLSNTMVDLKASGSFGASAHTLPGVNGILYERALLLYLKIKFSVRIWVGIIPLPKINLIEIPLTATKDIKVIRINNALPYDNAPGGFFATSTFVSPDPSLTLNVERFSFIPTYSSLNMRGVFNYR